MRRIAALMTAIGLCLLLSLPAVAQPGLPPCARSDGTSFRDAHWQSMQPKHPLVGQVLKGDQPIATQSRGCTRSPLQQLTEEVWDTIRRGGIVLLGEVHDNPEHHAVRADILWPRIAKLADTQGLRPAAVFEHIRTTQQSQLDGFHRKAGRTRRVWRAADLLRDLDWKNSGWPAAEIFYPLFDAALWARMPIYPGNGDRQRMRALARGEVSNASPRELELLDMVKAMPQPLLEPLAAELAQSHCGVLPATALPAMSLAQRYTDAHLADVAVRAARAHKGAFLLAGNGHVRADRGVPWYVRRQGPQMQVVAVTLLEVEDGVTDPQAYLPRGPDGKVATDYTLFTPRHDRPDPCAVLRDQFKAPKQ